MEIFAIILMVGFAYIIGLTHGSHLGFCARQYHNPVVIIASQHDDSYMAHDFTDHKFLAQAKTVDELGLMVKEKYPDKTIVIAGEV